MTCPCVYHHDDTKRNTIHIHSCVRNTLSLDSYLVHMSGSIAKFCDSTSIMNRTLVLGWTIESLYDLALQRPVLTLIDCLLTENCGQRAELRDKGIVICRCMT